MAALEKISAWGQQEEARGSIPLAGRRSLNKNMPRGWNNFLGERGGGAEQGDTAGLGVPKSQVTA